MNGSIQRDALDHFLLFSEKQIVSLSEKVWKEPVLGGLHHTYYRSSTSIPLKSSIVLSSPQNTSFHTDIDSPFDKQLASLFESELDGLPDKDYIKELFRQAVTPLEEKTHHT